MKTGSDKRRILQNIADTIVRGEVVDGVYEWAEFKYRGKNTIRVIADKFVNFRRVGSEIYKNGEIIKRSVVSNGRYVSVNLGFGDNLEEHQLLAAALVPGALEALLDTKEDYVINHKTITVASVIARENRRKYLRQVRELSSGNNVVPDINLFLSISVPDCDARDLEICTYAENTAHSAFIRTFDLYDIPISAKDIPLLKQFIINRNQVRNTMRMYEEYGADVLEAMIRG